LKRKKEGRGEKGGWQKLKRFEDIRRGKKTRKEGLGVSMIKCSYL